MRGACRQALLGKLLSAAVLFRGALHHTCSYMRAYLSTLDQNTRHECSTIAKLSAGAGVFYHKLQRSGKVVHEALIQYTCSHCIHTCPEGVGVHACVCDVIKMAVWPCACRSRQRLQRNWRISADQWSSYRIGHIWIQRGSSSLAEDPSLCHEFDPETITAQNFFRCMALDTVVPPHPPGVPCAQTGRPPWPGAPKRPLLRPGSSAALTPVFFRAWSWPIHPFLTGLSASETGPQAVAWVLPYARRLGKEKRGRGGGGVYESVLCVLRACACACACVCVWSTCNLK